MRTVAATIVLCLASMSAPPARAEAPRPVGRKTPPQGLFFDDAIAVSPDGRSVATLSTDAASATQLELWFPATEPAVALRVQDPPPGITALRFVGPSRLLVISKKEGSAKLSARLAEISGSDATARVVLGKKALGPADAIDVVEREGKPAIALYTRSARKGGADHAVQLFSADGQKLLGKRTLAEDAEGQLRTRSGEVRALWWSAGHTTLNAQKLGEYDKARDIRRPHRFIRLDVLTDKVLEEKEIEDVMGFTKASLAHKATPDADAFLALSEDQNQVILHDGLSERAVPLARSIDVYDKSSLRAVLIDGQRFLMGLQVEPNNHAALARKQLDADEIDLYVVDRAAKDAIARRVLVLPGEGRSAAFTASGGRVALLRKGKGFDRGGVAVELYALP